MFPNPRLLRLADKSRFWLALTISLGFISGLLVLGQARAVSQIVSRVFRDGSGLEEVARPLFITLVLFSTRGLLAWLSGLSAKTIAVQVKSRVRGLLIDRLQILGPAYLQGEKSGELSRTVVEGVEALDAYFSQYLPQLVLSILVPLTILLFVFPMDLLSGAVLLITAPLIPYFMYLIGGSARAITDRQYSTLSRLATQFLDSLQGLTTLRIFNRAQDQVEKIRQASEGYRTTTMQVLRVTFLSALALELLATLSTAVVAVEIGLRLLYFRVSLEQALFMLMIAPEFYIPLRLLGLRFHAGMEGQSAAARIFEILDTQPLIGSAPEDTAQEPLSLPLERLEFKGVSFTYPGQNRPALDGIDLVVERGQKIALVGKSGSGKSTLASLILGFFPPGSGQILVNGTPLKAADPAAWRQGIAWVPQDPALFQDSISANIRLARPDADDSAVAAAASAAHLAGFVDSLPAGYQTLIGEGGARLSGGQAQRLALARAFLKDAPLLLLDEPTSQLDPATETQLAEATSHLMRGRTVITIAHRLNTVFQADQILVLDQGRIVERGTHQELMEKGREYQQLVEAYTGAASLIRASGLEEASEITSQLAEQQAPDPTPPPLLEDADGIQEPVRVLQRLLGFFRPHWQEVLLSAFLGLLTIASSMGLMGASAWLICTAALHPNIAVLQIAIVGVRFFGIARGISRYFERLVSHNLTFKILTRLRVWFYRSLIPLAPARVMQYRAGDLLSRIVSDVKALEDFFVRSLAPPLVAIQIGLAVALFLLPYQGWLSVLALGFFLLGGLASPLLIRVLADRPGRELVNSRSGLAGDLTGFIQGLPDLLVFGGAERKSRQLEEQDRIYGQTQLKLARISGLSDALQIIISNLAMWLVLISAIPLVESGRIPGVMLAALALVVLSSFEAVQPLPLAMETLSSSLRAGGRLMEILDAEPEVADPDHPQRPALPVSLDAGMLKFTYPGEARPALEDLSFQVKPGQVVALVGPSGAGKSTLANLLLRFWGNYQGSFFLGADNTPLESIAQDETRHLLSVVSQNSYLLDGSVLENISLARAGAAFEEVSAAARQARIHQRISTLPEGYQTLVGERGTRLSAGERQRIAIARAVLKDAPFFLLDEPTANLDPITEREVLSTLFEILANRTGLLITHRLVGLERVDQILVIDQGQIIQRGTEAELLGQPGLYRRMWLLQNRLLNY